MSKTVIKITEAEKNEIENLFERKTALENLTKMPDIMQNPDLYEKLIADYGKTTIRFQEWWSAVAVKYALDGKEMQADFENCSLIEI